MLFHDVPMHLFRQWLSREKHRKVEPSHFGLAMNCASRARAMACAMPAQVPPLRVFLHLARRDRISQKRAEDVREDTQP